MFIDVHCHLIYGVDDGARSFEGTKKMIRDAVNNNVSAMITTPHITPGQERFPYDDYLAHLEETRAYLAQENIPITLYTGAEILYTHNTPEMLMEGRVPTMAGTQFVLLEFSPDDTFKFLLDAGKNVASCGYVPIYAHVERYECLKKLNQISRLRDECNAQIQVNARTVVKKHKFFKERWVRKLLGSGMVDYVATDCHDLPGRDNCMAACFERLQQDLGPEAAHALTHGNAEKLLSEA